MSDVRTIWVFREAHKEYDLIDELLAQPNGQITTAGEFPRQGQFIAPTASAQSNAAEWKTSMSCGRRWMTT